LEIISFLIFSFFFLVKMPRKRHDCSYACVRNSVLNEGWSKKPTALKFNKSRSTLQHKLKNLEPKVTCRPTTVLAETILGNY